MLRLSIIVLFSFLSFSLLSQSYENIESVEYDPTGDRFFISNSNSIIERASNGDLSYFGVGQAEFGMEIMAGKLFVIFDKSIRAYDLDSADEVMSVEINESTFLNGLTNNGNGLLWATDFSAGKIYQIDATDVANPSYELFVDNLSTNPNGIHFDEENDQLIYVNWGSNAPIQSIDISTKQITEVTGTSLGNVDGIATNSNNEYFISHWIPNGITMYPNDFSTPTTVTVPGINKPADICYAKEIDVLAIPNNGTELILVDFSPSNVEAKNIHETNLSLSPNPIQSYGILEFYLSAQKDVQIYCHDLQGQFVSQILKQNLGFGKHKVVIQRGDLNTGVYLLSIETGDQILSTKMIIAE